MATTLYLPPYSDNGAGGERPTCLLDSSLEASSGGQQVAHPGDTLTFRYQLLSDASNIGVCNFNQDVVTCTWATSCKINGVDATQLNAATAQYYKPSGVNQRVPRVFKRNQVAADGIYECVFTLDPAATEVKFSSPTSVNGAWVGVHTYPYNGTGHGWAEMIPFNLVFSTLEYGEEDKIRRDLGLQWPNPFGDSYCLICDVVSGLWKLVNKTVAPASLGYGWNLAGHNISVAEDPHPDPANPDMVLQDGTGSFDRWKKDPVTGAYSARYANNFATLTKDAVTGLVTITQKDKVVMNFGLDGKLSTIVDRNGNTTDYHYTAGRLDWIDDREGRRVTYIYSGPLTDGRVDDGQPYQVLTQDAGRLVTFEYDPTSARLHKVINAMGEATTLDYYSDGSLWKKTDARGKVEVEYTYGGGGKVATETRYGERRFTYTYSGLYSLTVKDEDLTLPDPAADARTSVYRYNDRYRLMSMTDPLGSLYQWEYNDPINPYLMTKIIDPNNAPTDYAYDLMANVTSFKNAKERVTSMTYDQGYLLKTIQRPPVTVGTSTLTYSPTTLDYDLKGNLTSVTDVLNGVPYSTVFAPGPDGRPLTVTDRLGKTTTFTYTAESPLQNKGNLETITLPADTSKGDPARVMTFSYDKSDNQIGVLDSGGNPTTYDYDLANRVTKTMDAFSKYVDFEFVNGLLDAIEMPSLRDATDSGLRRRTEFLPDDAGQVLQVVSQKSQAVGDQEIRVRHEYDGRSNLKKLIRLKDAMEKPAYEFSYDVLDRTTQQKNPLGDISLVSHDPYCKNYQVRSARGVVTEVSRDSLCRVTEVANPDEVRTFNYDELDRLTSIVQTHYPGGRYVDPGHLPEGPPSTFHHARFGGATFSETTSFLYDEWDRLVQVTYPGNKTVFYDYDLQGRVVQLTDVLGNITQYSYYNDGKLYQVTAVASPANQVFTYSYDQAGGVKEIQYPASSKVVAQFYEGSTSGWDANGRLTKVRYLLDGLLLQAFTYTYDDSGNRKSMVDTPGTGSPITWEYTYDWFNRLNGVKQNGTLKAVYVYDESDNRTEMQLPTVTHGYFYDYADRLLERRENGSVVEMFHHDKDGNMTDRTLAGVMTTYQWDSSNKLTSIKKPAFQEKYLYDAGGVRKSKGSDTRYFSSGGASISDLRPTNSMSFIQGDQIRGMRYGSSFYWYILDGLGTVRSVVDSAGIVAGSYAGDEFGRQTAATGSLERPHSYTGGLGVRNEVVNESKLLYARQRWYDPALGRWLSADPIGFNGGLGLYNYVGQNPINFADPEGLEYGPKDLTLDLFNIAVGVAFAFLDGPAPLGDAAGYAYAAPSAARLSAQAFAYRQEIGAAYAGVSVSLHIVLAKVFNPNGSGGNSVYTGVSRMSSPNTCYVGIAKNVARRQTQHGGRFKITELVDKLTRDQARAIEQFLIDRARGLGLNYQNAINSISPTKNKQFYQDAATWAGQFFQNNPQVPLPK